MDTKQDMEGTTETQSPYQAELQAELAKLNPDDYAHATRLLTEETKRVQSGDKYKCVSLVEMHHDRPSSNALKIRIPVKEFPKFNFVGKLLGPKGNTLKTLQQETGCKLSILGRGSMRDKTKEEELRKEGGKYAHLNEDLHVMVECFAETVDAYTRIAHAVAEIKKFMVPEAQDDYGMQQSMGQGDDRGYYNGDNSMGRGRGGPAPRGAPGGRGGLLSTPGGMPPPPRGGMAPRGGNAPRGAPAPRGGPSAPRGGPPSRGAPAPRGGPSMRGGALLSRGGPPTRGAPPSRGAPPPQRGSMGAPRGRGLPSLAAPPPRPQALVQEYEDYGAGAYENQEVQAYGQESQYDDGYSSRSRDPYVEEPAYSEPAAAGGDTQYFDYGHGAGAQSYDEYEPPRSVGYDRGVLKAPAPAPARGGRGQYRPHPYESTRPAMQSRY